MGIKMNTANARRDIRAIGDRLPEAAKRAGATEFGLFVDETKLRVPKETTALVESAKTSDRHTKSNFSWRVDYGNSNVDNVGIDYAAAVHEIVSAYHAPPTSAKYVESPLMQWKPRFHRAIANAVRRAV